jgi:hypothetical protein
MNQELSSLRSQLLKAQQQLPQLLEECFGREPLLPGSIYTLRRKCGKPNCRCSRGELHESTVLSYRGQGRPRNVTPLPEQLGSLQAMTHHYRRCRQARTKLVRWQRQLLTLIDALEAARVRQGEAEFRNMRESPGEEPSSPRS